MELQLAFDNVEDWVSTMANVPFKGTRKGNWLTKTHIAREKAEIKLLPCRMTVSLSEMKAKRRHSIANRRHKIATSRATAIPQWVYNALVQEVKDVTQKFSSRQTLARNKYYVEKRELLRGWRDTPHWALTVAGWWIKWRGWMKGQRSGEIKRWRDWG